MDIREAFNLIILLIFLLAFYRIVRDPSNELEFWQIFSTKAADGKIYFDLDKFGQLVGLVFSTWIVTWLAYGNHLNDWTGVVIFAAWLIYASGMGAFSKWARAFITSRYASEHRPEPTRTETKT